MSQAYEIDDATVAVSAAGAVIPGVPGVWRPGDRYTAEALGVEDAELASAIDELGLPLRKSDQAGSDVLARPDDPQRVASGPVGPVVASVSADDVAAMKVGDLDDRFGQMPGYPSGAVKADKVAWVQTQLGLVVPAEQVEGTVEADVARSRELESDPEE